MRAIISMGTKLQRCGTRCRRWKRTEIVEILGTYFVLASFFRERSSGEKWLISYRSSTLALVRFGNASHEILADSSIMRLPNCHGYYLPAMGPSTFGDIMGSDLGRELTQRRRIPRVLKAEAWDAGGRQKSGCWIIVGVEGFFGGKTRRFGFGREDGGGGGAVGPHILTRAHLMMDSPRLQTPCHSL